MPGQITHINEDVLAFYRNLPFNYYSEPRVAAESLRGSNPIVNYPDLVDVLKKGKSVLDVGCGAGWLVNAINHYFGSYGTRAEGLDANPVALEQAAAVATILDSESKFLEKDLFLYEPARPYDLVISLGVLHHTNNCIEAVRHICKRFVAPGGDFYLGLYHKYGRKPFLDHFAKLKESGALEEELREEFRRLLPHNTDETHFMSWFRDQVLHPHETQHSVEEINTVLEDEGMRLVSTSINKFAPIDTLAAIFEQEKDYLGLGEKRLREGTYFPGFFVVFAHKPS